VTSGAVLLDGHDIRTSPRQSLRRQVGVVLQDNVLFGGTVLDNLRLARPGASDAELIDAARERSAPTKCCARCRMAIAPRSARSAPISARASASSSAWSAPISPIPRARPR
jgi:ABC-type uncharacterized transport system ATPase subunit